MAKIRVMVVEDSVVMRRLIADIINRDPELEAVGVAQDGRVALGKMQKLNPDVVTLDVEMPVLDGLGTLRVLRKDYPDLPVIMFSTVTQRCAAATLEALAIGACDYVTKPSKVANLSQAIEQVERELIPKLKHFAKRSRSHAGDALAGPGAVAPRPTTRPGRPQPVRALIIGASTGGPAALTRLLAELPRDLHMPVLIVQHMPPTFTKLLAERLNVTSALPVVEGANDMPVEPGRVYIAPGDFHMIVARQGTELRLKTLQTPPENFCRPAVDVLFRSAADTFGGECLAVVLTGMGSDGLRGAELIRERGGCVLAQDRASSVVWGMPGAVVTAGQADGVAPLERMAMEITLRIRSRSDAARREVA